MNISKSIRDYATSKKVLVETATGGGCDYITRRQTEYATTNQYDFILIDGEADDMSPSELSQPARVVVVQCDEDGFWTDRDLATLRFDNAWSALDFMADSDLWRYLNGLRECHARGRQCGCHNLNSDISANQWMIDGADDDTPEPLDDTVQSLQQALDIVTASRLSAFGNNKIVYDYLWRVTRHITARYEEVFARDVLGQA